MLQLVLQGSSKLFGYTFEILNIVNKLMVGHCLKASLEGGRLLPQGERDKRGTG